MCFKIALVVCTLCGVTWLPKRIQVTAAPTTDTARRLAPLTPSAEEYEKRGFAFGDGAPTAAEDQTTGGDEAVSAEDLFLLKAQLLEAQLEASEAAPKASGEALGAFEGELRDAFVAARQEDPSITTAKMFSSFDTNRNGKLDQGESPELDEMFERAGLSVSVDFEQFKQMRAVGHGKLNTLKQADLGSQAASCALELPRSAEAAKHCGFDEHTHPFAQYLSLHNRMVAGSAGLVTRPGSERFAVWRCSPGQSCGGIGDRLKKWANTLMFAIEAGRALLIDDPELEVAFTNERINWSYSQHRERVDALSTEKCFDGSLEMMLEMEKDGADELQCQNSDKEVVIVTEIIGPKDIRKQLKMFPTGFEVGCMVHAMFRPRAPLCNAYAALHKVAFKKRSATTLKLKRRTVVGVHMRMGDEYFLGNKMPTEAALEALDQAGNCAAELVPSRHTNLLFTDSTDLKRVSGTTNDPFGTRWKATDIVPCHAGNLLDTCEKEGHTAEGVCVATGKEEAARCIIESWAEHFLLASCDAVLGTPSGFSMTAMSLGFVPSEKRLSFDPVNHVGCHRCNNNGWCVDQTWWIP